MGLRKHWLMKMTLHVQSRHWSSKDRLSCSIYATDKTIQELSVHNHKFRWWEGCYGAFTLIYIDELCGIVVAWLVAYCFTPSSKVPYSYRDGTVPFIVVISEDPCHSHLLPSVSQWSCHYLFLRLRSVAAGIQTPNLPLAGPITL